MEIVRWLEPCDCMYSKEEPGDIAVNRMPCIITYHGGLKVRALAAEPEI